MVLHAILGAATVAATTHCFAWTWRFPRGNFSRFHGARWLATTALVLYAAQFVLGNLMYPVYKVRVRAEFLDLPSAVAEEAKVRQAARDLVDDRRRAEPGGAQSHVGPSRRVEAPRGLSHIARLFDIKEHWAALGLVLALATCLLTWGWNPHKDGPGGSRLILVLSAGAATCAWFAGVVGIICSSFRSMGGVL